MLCDQKVFECVPVSTDAAPEEVRTESGVERIHQVWSTSDLRWNAETRLYTGRLRVSA
jgi:hypothetical protein